jgi:adenylate cyclase class IV
MIEARIFTDSLDYAKSILSSENALNKGNYEINDTIFRRTDNSTSLTDEFLRLRTLPINIWPDKSVVLAVKKTKLQAIGKHSEIPLKLQFDTHDKAESYVNEHLSTEYTEDFSFTRIGWQYFLPNGDVVDLEIIEGTYPSIEFKSETAEGIAKLLSLFHVSPDEAIQGPSVVAVKKLLNR